MARKRRKNVEAAALAPEEVIRRPYRAGVYARLSLETEQTRENGTIETQIELVKNFAADSEDISVEEVYADSDYSGTNFERPGFMKMMEDIKNGRINCVIVKDLSRLGRNYVETSNYIERVFPFFNVRFIAVTDDFDSFREGVDLTVPLKNIINEFYSKDLAKKSNSAKKALCESGKFVGAWAPYGYRKSEKDHHVLVVDEEAAENVRDMYKWYLDGARYSEIAGRLNGKGVLSPVLLRKYYRTGLREDAASQPWNGYEIKRILLDRHNIGDCVYGRYRQSKFIADGKMNVMPEEDWFVKEGTHEPIINREDYEKVKEKITADTASFKKRCKSNNGSIRPHNFYSGKIFCGGCGNRMVLTRSEKTLYYRCGANMNHKAGGSECPGHSVRKEDVDYEVLRLTQIHMKAALDMESFIRDINSSARNQTRFQLLDKEVTRLRRELGRISKRKGGLYEDYCDRLITEEEYIQLSKVYETEIGHIKERIDITLGERMRYSKDYHLEDGWGTAIHNYMSKRKLTAEMAEAFVKSITIHGKYDYEIKLVYDDLFADLEELKREKEVQKK